jgi:hypothetical protein
MYKVRKSFLCFSLVILATVPAHAQAPERDLDKLRQLVEAGAAPRAALDLALADLEDQADDLLLRQTLYSVLRPEEVTPQQASDMVAAAQRRLDRKQKRVDALKPLIEQGIMARTELTPHLEELDFRRRTLDLARSRAEFLQRLTEMAKTEQAIEQETEDSFAWKPVVERFNGAGVFNRAVYKKILLAWEKQFGKSLPVSADGETALHRSLGFDHRGRVDVAVNPDDAEGKWLVDLLKVENIPFYAIRGAVPGKSTGAHIHIGPPSTRLRIAD